VQKQAPSLGRILVMVGFALSCFGLLLFLWVAFGGSTPLKAQGYRFTTSFGEATQLAQEADVRISGVSVGKVKTIEPDKKTGRSQVVIQMDAKYSPVAKDTKAILRQKTLLGETYVELTPGNGRRAGWLPEDGTLPASRVSSTVELDEIFRTFDPKTQAAFRNWMQQQAIGVDGRAQDINDTIGNLAPFSEDTNVILQILAGQSDAVRRLVRNTGVVFDALSERQGQLSSLISNSNTVFQTTAARNRQLQQAFVALPTFEKEATRTVNRLTTFAAKTNPLVNQLRPAAQQLSPTLQDLQALSPDLKALFRDLDPLITASKKGMPATQKFLDELHPLLAEADPVLRQLNPILGFIGQYKQELNAFFSNTVAATQASNIPPGGNVNTKVHYLRTTNPINLENLAVYDHRLPTSRPNPYQMPGAFRDLKDGLKVYEDRQCKNPAGGVPFVGSLLSQLTNALPANLKGQVSKVLGGATSAIAPPCKKQGPYTNADGTKTDYPHVVPSTGSVARAKKAHAQARTDPVAQQAAEQALRQSGGR
jgi:virulence factor Mce-like protein